MRRLSRRATVVLIGLAATLFVCSAGFAGVLGWVWTSAKVDTAGKVDFRNQLAIPPLAPSTVDGDGRRVFQLTTQRGEHDFGDGKVPTWGFNGAYLGPTLRASRGETVLVKVRNTLDEETTVHWHGMHLPPEMDGGPHQTIEPGGTWNPTWTIDQPAASLWYHPHPHGATARHVYRGLAGMFIVDDRATDVASLPHTYGVDDVPVIVQDKKFDDGQLDESHPSYSSVGLLGDEVTVNGTLAPHLNVTTERVRLRILNGSNARVYNFGFTDGRRFDVVGTDGGLLPAPASVGRLPLSPGERAEIVVRMAAGERAVLRSYPTDLGGGFGADRLSGADDTLDVLQLRAASRVEDQAAVPERLVAVPHIDREDAATTRTFRLGGNTINRKKMDMARIDATVTAGSVEVWRIDNAGDTFHNFHVHDVQFQVLTVAGRPPPPRLRGWKDTVLVRAGDPVEIAIRFGHHTNAQVPYMFHCHILRHEDNGMMGQFAVVEPGQEPGRPGGHDTHVPPAGGGDDHSGHDVGSGDRPGPARHRGH